jgi:hypothetical protein
LTVAQLLVDRPISKILSGGIMPQLFYAITNGSVDEPHNHFDAPVLGMILMPLILYNCCNSKLFKLTK